LRDFVLDDEFLRSCVDLHEETREKILSQLRAFSENPRDRDLGVARVEGQKDVLSLPVDGAHCIFLRRVRSITTLLFVTENKSASTSVTSKRSMNTDDVVLAPVHALETLLVEEKYLPLARHLLKAPAATAELQFHFKEIEEILNAHLPPEARQFVNWWANQKSGKRAHAFAWMAAGWLIPKVDIKADRVTFKRRGSY